MNDKCFDIGTIQAFFDGELAAETLDSVSRHIASCDDCAIFLAEAEEESSTAFSALEQEFNTLVPTQRLWTKINDSIQKEKKTFWQTVLTFFSNQTTVAFASVLIVFSVFMALLSFDNNEKALEVAEINQNTETVTAVPNIDSGISELTPKQTVSAEQPAMATPNYKKPKIERISEFAANKSDARVIKAPFVKTNNLLRKVYAPEAKPESSEPAAGANVPGEDSYIRTIATLEKTVESRKDDVLKASARFAFERDLAVSDDAIKKIKAEVRKNPKDESAKQVLRASYQNKIDLLNSVADKTELMASLR